MIPWMEMDRNGLCVRVLCALIFMILFYLLLGAAGYTCKCVLYSRYQASWESWCWNRGCWRLYVVRVWTWDYFPCHTTATRATASNVQNNATELSFLAQHTTKSLEGISRGQSWRIEWGRHVQNTWSLSVYWEHAKEDEDNYLYSIRYPFGETCLRKTAERALENLQSAIEFIACTWRHLRTCDSLVQPVCLWSVSSFNQ